MSNDWKAQLAGVSKQLDLSVVRATHAGTAALRHTPMSALTSVRQQDPELLFEGQPLPPAVRQWLSKVRHILQRETDNRVLIVGCQQKNIDPKNTGFVDGKRIILFENDEGSNRIIKPLPLGVGVLFQARFMSHGRMLPLINAAKNRVDQETMQPNPVLVVPVLRPTEIRQLITLGSMPEDDLLSKLIPRVAPRVQAAIELASPETRAASAALLNGAVRKFVQGEAPVLDVRGNEEEDDHPTDKPKKGFVQLFIEKHPALPGEGVTAQARRLLPLAMKEFGRPPELEKNTFRTLETTISTARKRLAVASTPSPSVPTPDVPPPPPPPPPPREEPPPAPPRPLNDRQGGTLDKPLSALDALAESLDEISLHAERMSNHGKVLAEHGRQLGEQIGFARFAIDSLRGDLKAGWQADIEQRVRAALAHVMGPL